MALALVGSKSIHFLRSESQKDSRRNTKYTFQGIHSKLILHISFKGFPHIIYMVMDFFGLRYNIIGRISRYSCKMS